MFRDLSANSIELLTGRYLGIIFGQLQEWHVARLPETEGLCAAFRPRFS